MAFPLEGDLARFDFAEVVQAVHLSRRSGLLRLTRGPHRKDILVDQGRLVFASSTDPDERMGEVLLRRGRITLAQYDAASAALGPGRRLGTLLVERGALAAGDLVRAVVDHTQEILWNAFQWSEGQYRFEEGGGHPEMITLRMSTPEIVLEGLRRVTSWSRIQRGCGSADARYRAVPGSDAVAEQARLSMAERELLAVLGAGGDWTVGALCERSTLNSFEVCRTLWAYRVVGLAVREGADALHEDEGLDLVLEG